MVMLGQRGWLTEAMMNGMLAGTAFWRDGV